MANAKRKRCYRLHPACDHGQCLSASHWTDYCTSLRRVSAMQAAHGHEVDDEFSVREFLRERKALLVHFSTVMARRRDLLFPEDLDRATRLHEVPLSFSTILQTDIGPNDPKVEQPALANAPGTVGIVVDVESDGDVLTVGPSDDGTYLDSTEGTWISEGEPPPAKTCA